MPCFLNSIRKIVIRVTSSKRYQNVRSDLTIFGPFANVTLTLCVSWVVTYFWQFVIIGGCSHINIFSQYFSLVIIFHITMKRFDTIGIGKGIVNQ